MCSTPLNSRGFQGGRLLGALVLATTMIAISACQTTEGLDPASKAEEAQRERRAFILSSDFFKAAESALSDRRIEEAKARFRQIIAVDPDHAGAKLGLAEAFLASGDPSKAAALFRDLTAISSIRHKALQGEGLALIRLNRVGPAREKLESAVAANGDLWRAWNGLGQIYDRRNQFIKAETCYGRALTLTDRKALVRNNLGYSYILQGRYRDAEKQFIMALDEDITLTLAMDNLRLSLAWQGRYVDAMAGVTVADRPRMMNNIGYVAMLRGEYGRAEAYFTRAMAASASFYRVASRNLDTLRTLTAKRNQEAEVLPAIDRRRKR